jgi:hypothetical protein
MKKFLIVLFVVVFAVVFFSLQDKDEAVVHGNSTDLKVTLYSDRHITQNAVVSDVRFRNIAFATPDHSPFEDQVASVWQTLRYLVYQPKAEKESGSWLWTPLMQMSSNYMSEIISGAKREKVDVIYFSIDSYLDIYALRDGAEKNRQEKAFADKLESFVKLANENGIEVDAEAGWRNWAEPGHEYKGVAVADFAMRYNASREHKLRGFQYDVEPYLLDGYHTDPAPILKNFVALVDKTREHLQESGLRFSVVIPDFYDKRDETTPEFSYNGRTDFTFAHLLRILDKEPHSSIIIMSYRNSAEGKDGSIEISKNEMRSAKRHPTKVVIAQETGPATPSFLTFYGLAKKDLHTELAKIDGAFRSYPSFGGLAIHFANAYLSMK